MGKGIKTNQCDVCDYEIKQIDSNNYEMKLLIKDIERGFIKAIIDKTLKTLEKKEVFKRNEESNKLLKDFFDSDEYIRFIIDKRYYKLMSTSLISVIRKINLDIKKDNYFLVNDKIEEAHLYKIDKKYTILIKVSGLISKLG